MTISNNQISSDVDSTPNIKSSVGLNEDQDDNIEQAVVVPPPASQEQDEVISVTHQRTGGWIRNRRTVIMISAVVFVVGISVMIGILVASKSISIEDYPSCHASRDLIQNGSSSLCCLLRRSRMDIDSHVQACEFLEQEDLIPYKCENDKDVCCTVPERYQTHLNIREEVFWPHLTDDEYQWCERVYEKTQKDECDPEGNPDVDCACPRTPTDGCVSSCFISSTDNNDNYYSCNCFVDGRPFVDASGKVLAASPVIGRADVKLGLGEGESPMLDKSTITTSTKKNQQHTLGEGWTKNALGEHASVASFAAFTIALMANGAPSSLVEDSLKAGLDEVQHAKISFDIASKLIGRKVRPSALPPSHHEFNHDLKALGMAVAKEGCVDETLSAIELAAEVEFIDKVLKGREGEDSTKYDGVGEDTLLWIRNELQTIALDESKHAELAWCTIKWVCSIDNEVCDAVKSEVLNEHMLDTAFHRRFASLSFNDISYHVMMDKWKKIYRRDIGGDSVEASDHLGSVTEAGM